MKLLTEFMQELAEAFFAIPPHEAIARRRMMFGDSQKREVVVNGKKMFLPVDIDSYKDLAATLSLIEGCQTILMPNELLMQFVEMSKQGRIQHEREFPLPFQHVCIQPVRWIPEKDFFPIVERNDFQDFLKLGSDSVEGIIMGRDRHPKSGKYINTICAWFLSQSVNRTAWWEDSGLWNSETQDMPPNKIRLRDVGTAISMYLMAENVEVVAQEVPKRINARRKKRGKRELPKYYETRITKVSYAAQESRGKGAKHSFMYPVRAHFRRYKDGHRTWIPQHYRGVEHGMDSMPERHAYRVAYDKEDG
jgi:hypothetical protein